MTRNGLKVPRLKLMTMRGDMVSFVLWAGRLGGYGVCWDGVLWHQIARYHGQVYEDRTLALSSLEGFPKVCLCFTTSHGRLYQSHQ